MNYHTRNMPGESALAGKTGHMIATINDISEVNEKTATELTHCPACIQG